MITKALERQGRTSAKKQLKIHTDLTQSVMVVNEPAVTNIKTEENTSRSFWPNWFRDILDNAKLSEKVLCYLAVVSLILGIDFTIYALVSSVNNYVSAAYVISSTVLSLWFGLFAAGLMIGLSSVMISLRKNAISGIGTVVKILNITALVLLILGVVTSIFFYIYYGTLLSGTTLNLGTTFILMGMGPVSGAVIAFLAVWISRLNGIHDGLPIMDKILYGLAIIGICLGIIADIVTGITFSFIVLGVIAGGILLGAGGILSSTKPIISGYYCDNCGKDIKEEWSLCPHCEGSLENDDVASEAV